jgi:hypothetical protein
MPLLMNLPEWQFVDADGHPYAGGTVTTLVPGTSTPKTTWSDHDGTAMNTNPIVLDSAGRCIVFGDGEYRIILRDADGNLIYDQWTSSIVSDAMQPVVMAATIAEARDLLGITDAIQGETDRALAAEAALGQRITDETNRATGAEQSLRDDLNAEIDRAKAAEDYLFGLISDAGTGMPGMRFGGGTTDGTGAGGISFSPPFDTACDSIVACLNQNPINCTIRTAGVSASGALALVEDTDNSGGQAGVAFYWIAIGH